MTYIKTELLEEAMASLHDQFEKVATRITGLEETKEPITVPPMSWLWGRWSRQWEAEQDRGRWAKEVEESEVAMKEEREEGERKEESRGWDGADGGEDEKREVVVALEEGERERDVSAGREMEEVGGERNGICRRGGKRL